MSALLPLTSQLPLLRYFSPEAQPGRQPLLRYFSAEAQPGRQPSLLRYFSAEADPESQPSGVSGVSGLQSRNPQPADPDLRAACTEFESIFLSLLFRQMRSTVPSGGILPRGAAEDIFDSLWTQEISRLSARSSPLRIADALVAALSSPASDETPPALKPTPRPTEDTSGMPRIGLPGHGTGASQRPAGSRAPVNAGGRRHEDHQ